MTYTAAEVLTLVTAIGVLLAGFGAVIVNIIVALRTDRSLKENTAISSATLTEAKVISGHVNSRETKLSEQIIAAERENELLRELISDKSATAALLAQAVAARQHAQPADEAPPPDGTLQAIEVNTDATAKNTARTEATVDALKAGTS